jgi:hypothetical protein
MKMLKVNIYAAVLFLAAMAPVASAASADQRIFFFGNSYTYYNGGIDLMVKALLEESLSVTVEAQVFTGNGAKLPRHLQELDGTNGDTAARQALITGSNTSWDLVVLQDQSMVPAYHYSSDFYASRDAGVEINKLIEPTGAVTMFLSTWARQYSDFPTMQERLNDGYREYQYAAKDPLSFVAPAGVAFELVYHDTIAKGGTSTSAPFSSLYKGDGSHPSDQGSYLAACVIFSAYTGLPSTGLKWKPTYNVNVESRDYLQRKADEAVFGDETFVPSRWDVPGFVGPGDKLGLTASPTASPTATPTATPNAYSPPG